MRFLSTPVLRFATLIVVASILIVGVRPLVFRAHADILPDRNVELTSASPSETSSYSFSFNLVSNANIGSIRFQFCAESPVIGTPCTTPAGLDISGTTLADQQGETGFSILTGTDPNVIVLTRTASAPTPGTVRYSFDNIVNPNTVGSYYVRVETFSSEDATGSHIDHGGLAYSIVYPIQVRAKVPPYLLFCTGITIPLFDCSGASGDHVNFGELSSSTPKVAQSQALIATNADFGYNLFVNGTTMTSGTNVIPALTSPDVSRAGISQFGLNLVANSDQSIGANPAGPGVGMPTSDYAIPNRYKFVPGDVIATRTHVEDYRKYTMSYLVNVSKAQSPGVYASTLTYICLANF